LAVATCEIVVVVAIATLQAIIAQSTHQLVVAGPTEQLVIAGPTDQQVAAVATLKAIVPLAAIQHIFAIVPKQLIPSRTAGEPIVAFLAAQDFGTIAAVHLVVGFTSTDHAAASRAVTRIARRLSRHHISGSGLCQ